MEHSLLPLGGMTSVQKIAGYNWDKQLKTSRSQRQPQSKERVPLDLSSLLLQITRQHLTKTSQLATVKKKTKNMAPIVFAEIRDIIWRSDISPPLKALITAGLQSLLMSGHYGTIKNSLSWQTLIIGALPIHLFATTSHINQTGHLHKHRHMHTLHGTPP